VTERRNKKVVRAWGKAPVAGQLQIQRKRKRGWRTLKRRSVRAGQVFNISVRLKGSAKLRARVSGESSLAWRQRR
jgi:hypothetical protein